MANSFQLNNSSAQAGLGDFTYTVTTAGTYTFGCQSFLPHNASGTSLNSAATDPNQSNVSIVLKQNSSTLVTVGGAANNPTPTQPIISASTTVLCAANDVLHVVLASSNAIDSVPNNVKSIITLTSV